MNPTELLNLISNAPTVAFHKFVLLSKNRESDLFCFFEGKDSQYYSSRAKLITKRKCHPISCGNKKSVLATYDIFDAHSSYKNHLKAFFIDSDFDPPINKNGVYETPCYSVENLYVNSDCISEILKNEFLLIETDSQYIALMELFENELNVFSRETLLFNAWYATLKKKKRLNGLKSTCVSLDDKLPKGFICLKIGTITSNYDLVKIKATFPKAIEVTEEEVNETIKELNSPLVSQKLRGKFQMWFLYTFLQFLIDDANNSKVILENKTKFNIDRANIYTQLSQYATTTNCLESYLSTFI